jgi:hypothetical protein
MGWASGSELAEDVWTLVRRYTPIKDRQRIARKLVDIFEDRDADTMHEAERLWKDANLEDIE